MRKTIRLFSMVLASFMIFSVVGAAAATPKLQLFFAPQIMDYDTGEITVDVCLRNFDIALPKSYGDIGGLVFAIEYDTEHFTLKAQDGKPLTTDDATLIKSASSIEQDVEGGRISASFVDDTLGSNLIDRDGVLCRFVLVSKNPKPFWNSTDAYPLRFVPGSVGVIGYHVPSASVNRFDGAEGVDCRVGPYNQPAGVSVPSVGKAITFTAGGGMQIDGAAVETDALPYRAEGVMMLPLRALAENIGLIVEWDGAAKVAFADTQNLSLRVVPGGAVYVNARAVQPRLAPALVGDRLYISSDVVKLLYPDAVLTEDGDVLTVAIP